MFTACTRSEEVSCWLFCSIFTVGIFSAGQNVVTGLLHVIYAKHRFLLLYGNMVITRHFLFYSSSLLGFANILCRSDLFCNLYQLKQKKNCLWKKINFKPALNSMKHLVLPFYISTFGLLYKKLQAKKKKLTSFELLLVCRWFINFCFLFADFSLTRKWFLV